MKKGDTKLKATSRLEKTAYHEAGHAIVAHFNYLHFKHVSIKKNSESLGHVSFIKPADSFFGKMEMAARSSLTPYLHDRVQKHIMVCLAGNLAVKIATGRRDFIGASFDHREAIELTERLGYGGHILPAYIRFLRLLTEAMLQRRWKFVEAVKTALIEKRYLSRPEIGEVICPGSFKLGHRITRGIKMMSPERMKLIKRLMADEEAKDKMAFDEQKPDNEMKK